MYIIEICKLYDSNTYLIAILKMKNLSEGANNNFLDLYVKLQTENEN